jgi:hypothetical protein
MLVITIEKHHLGALTVRQRNHVGRLSGCWRRPEQQPQPCGQCLGWRQHARAQREQRQLCGPCAASSVKLPHACSAGLAPQGRLELPGPAWPKP